TAAATAPAAAATSAVATLVAGSGFAHPAAALAGARASRRETGTVRTMAIRTMTTPDPLRLPESAHLVPLVPFVLLVPLVPLVPLMPLMPSTSSTASTTSTI